MKLTVIYADYFLHLKQKELGYDTKLRKRRITIDLTEVQTKKLQADIVGFENGQDQYEQLIDIFLEP